MGGSGGSTENRIRYAKHIEDAHKEVLRGTVVAGIMTTFNHIYVKPELAGDETPQYTKTPFGEYENVDVDEGFFGVVKGDTSRNYEMKNFPSLFDMYGKFIGGLDVHVLWGKVYEDVLHGPELANSVSAHADVLQTQIDADIMPRYLAGMRDINAVQSSAFMIGKALIERQKIVNVNEYQAKVRLSAMELSGRMWDRHLEWSRDVVTVYRETVQAYYSARIEFDRTQLEYKVKDRTWNMLLYDDLRAVIGALNGAAAMQTKKEPSQATKAVAGALSGAAAGSMVNVPWGTLVGAIAGASMAFI
jgi:hypothetical protein